MQAQETSPRKMPRTCEFRCYARAGLDLIPLHRYDVFDGRGQSRGKVPRDPKWQHRPYDSDAVVAEAERDGINLGVRLPETVVVIDNDPRNHRPDRNSLEALRDAYGLDLDQAPHTITGAGGDHYWFRIPPGIRVRGSLPDYPGVEFKSAGHQVVAAGSVHPKGTYYTLDDFAPPLYEMPELPAILLDALRRDGVAPTDVCAGGELSPDALASFLAQLNPCDFREHEEWRNLMMACHHATDGAGGDEFITWSTSDPAYADHASKIQTRWNTLGRSTGSRQITVRYLHKVAKEHGVSGPLALPEEDFGELPCETGLVAQSEFARNKVGKPINSLANCLIALRRTQPRLGLAYNEFTQRYVLTSTPLPWTVDVGRDLTDEVLRLLREFILAQYGLEASKENVAEAAFGLARQNPFHPVRHYLNDLTWDGTQRLDAFLPTYFGTEDSEYTRAVGAKTLLGAVRRVRKPGCKFDTVLVLEGEQGTGKSSSIRALCPSADWYSDSPLGGVDSKDAALLLQGCWIHELGEVVAVSKSDAEHLKAFLSRQEENVRKPYERAPTRMPRQCIFIGTTNQGGYLQDQTGNRRFWPVRTGSIDRDALMRDRDQLWAEAAMREQKGEPLELPRGLWWSAAEEQGRRVTADPWEGVLRDFLEERSKDDTLPSDRVFTRELLANALNLPAGQQAQAHSKRIRVIMEQCLGWKHDAIRIGSKTGAGYIRREPADVR